MTLRAPGPVVPAPAGVSSRRGRHRVLAVGLALAAWALLGCAVPGVAVGAGSLLTVIDNSGADSIVEIDRTADLLIGHGSAGSDHDGSTSLAPGLLGLTGSTTAPPAAEEDEE
ncbi:hypothetical protein [Kitasatospora purpeofusca]|uniref:hypothetical protein n=1 Tax=Kitasatospora purpeofusca TaxID=67352 RepID=UPI002259A35D|nr:hypothetical protein [Kitasatospora purpeofusca]MCX4759394.1 hypothetical protein [Kitasatospora purpeofusca]WSR30216.1 hypothetical protein OG715_04175 [Kitasatospora purpeofusca]WSR38451.1 hypothetical protein OG196_04775 [Kitasatospora purpeofusca]